jgi:hypothetical protein
MVYGKLVERIDQKLVLKWFEMYSIAGSEDFAQLVEMVDNILNKPRTTTSNKFINAQF